MRDATIGDPKFEVRLLKPMVSGIPHLSLPPSKVHLAAPRIAARAAPSAQVPGDDLSEVNVMGLCWENIWEHHL